MTVVHVQNPKSNTTTFLLNFFIPGAGHVYASGGERWGLLITNIICAVLAPFVYVTLAGNVIVWVIAMAMSASVTSEYNARLEQVAHAEVESRELDAKKVVGAEVARQFAKVHEMVGAGLVTTEEADRLRAETIATCMNGWTSEEMIEFLSPFAPLVKSGAISDSDLAEVKKAYALIRKSKPAMSA